MRGAFVPEHDTDHLDDLPGRPIAAHSNDVTETGLAQIEHALAVAGDAEFIRIR